MIVVTLSACPPSLRGDLTLWLQEIHTGTFVGYVNARVRDLLWERIQKTVRSGHATMVYSAKNEQGMEFRIHNGSWETVDCDGIKMVKRPVNGKNSRPKASQPAKTVPAEPPKLIQSIRRTFPKTYVVVDLETTGLKADSAQIIEIGALKVIEGNVQDKLNCFIRAEEVPEIIENMTGINEAMLGDGLDEKEAITGLIDFIGSFPIVAHNVKFDLDFIEAACKRAGIEWSNSETIDTVKMARELVPGLPSYKLENLLEHFQISHERLHRALSDSCAVYDLYCKLNEKCLSGQ